MSDPVPLSASDLRNAMRDPRYWRSGHPERADYFAWVSDGWRQLAAAERQPNSDGLVWVNPYTRRRGGETEDVSGHYRHAGGSPRGPTPDGGSEVTVAVEDQPTADIERRYTARDASGGLIASCERLTDGSQFCTLVLPDGRVAVQQLQLDDGEITPVAAPAIAAYGFPLLLGAMTSFYTYLQSRLRAVPGGDIAADTPFLLFHRVFEGTQADVRVTVGTLSSEQLNEFCPKTAEFEAMLADVAGRTSQEGLTPQQWGTAVHTALRHDIQRRYEPTANVVRAEFSVIGGTEGYYGQRGTTRLDIYHHVEGTSTICVYDIKTGQARLDSTQAGRIREEADSFARDSGVINPRVLIIELRPMTR